MMPVSFHACLLAGALVATRCAAATLEQGAGRAALVPRVRREVGPQWPASLVRHAEIDGATAMQQARKNDFLRNVTAMPRGDSLPLTADPVDEPGPPKLYRGSWKKWSLKDVVVEAKTWCKCDREVHGGCPPKKLQGFFWLQYLPLPDHFVCMTTGHWDAKTLTLKLMLWKDFMYSSSPLGRFAAWEFYRSKAHYLVKFEDDTLARAAIDIATESESRMDAFRYGLFSKIAHFPMVEDEDCLTPGDYWHRPSYFLGLQTPAMTYWVMRVMDGDGQILEDNKKQMEANWLSKWKNLFGFGRYEVSTVQLE